MLAEGNTIPFIARYRKEKTGELDEVKLREISTRLQYLESLYRRKSEVRRLIDEQGKSTPEIEKALETSTTLQQVEDIYLPFRPKRRTRATMAKEKGLEGLAEWLLGNERATREQLEEEAIKYINIELDVLDDIVAISGASDIIAERVSEDFEVRAIVRALLKAEGIITAKALVAEEGSVYEMYRDYKEPIKRIPPHRILALNRGEQENVLNVGLEYSVDKVCAAVTEKLFDKAESLNSVLGESVTDGCKRLLLPSIERELRAQMTEIAQEQAIKMFGKNLKQLLLISPVKGHTILAIDPAYRTGCKWAVINPIGKVLDTGVSYLTPPQRDVSGATRVILAAIKHHQTNSIVIGNGTGSRETEEFIANLIRENKLEVAYAIVNEAGASVYSASEVAGQELPDLDVTLRGAVSIGRRVQDPL
ncbi:MAG: Tex-like N-terminal domain-containing protein, partial [bacterium]|nr:Tex-like N-terminal domain-containing protein [bacterium]